MILVPCMCVSGSREVPVAHWRAVHVQKDGMVLISLLNTDLEQSFTSGDSRPPALPRSLPRPLGRRSTRTQSAPL